jgi:TolA-binding protein
MGLSEALVGLVHERQGHLSPAQQAAGEERLVARWKRPPVSRARLAWLSAAAVAAVAFALVVLAHRGTGALSYAVEGGHLGRQGTIELDPGQEARLHFSDGSDVAFAAGTQASLRRVDGQGAIVSVSTGSAHVDITHRPGARWSFEAGPFVIEVTGTAFRFGWDAPREELDVQMERGSIRVSGPLSAGTLPLVAGQHLIVHVRQGETVIREHDGASENTPNAPEPAASVDSIGVADSLGHPADPTSEAPAPSAAKPHNGSDNPGWQALLASGDSESILQQARHRGIDESIATATSGDLAALADAARYRRQDDIARQALLGQRRRFPASLAAHEAAFLLGRLEETRGKSAAAVNWYARYMKEEPSGTYASEALGRRMLLLQSTSPGDAHAAATEYLRRFPGGGYAPQAQALLRTP